MSKKFVFHGVALAAILIISIAAVQAAEVTVEKSEQGAVVKIDGELFTEYVTDINGTPACWPIIGPSGERMTRDYPMKEGPESERQDHPHHRSLWFNHGDVNGRSFWHIDPIVHREFVQMESDGETAVIVTRNDWVTKDTNETLCSDVRSLAFGVMDCGARYIDFDITITAVADEVVFGDTKEGNMGVRVPGTMKVDAADNNPEWGGHILNAEGLEDVSTWGKRSPWVDYYGPVEGETAGIAILNHPDSYNFPTYWHVRTYGLFAANPFGASYFDGGDADGTLELAKGEDFTLRYRIIFHEGDAEEAGIAQAYEAYSETE
jgi:hypothetical protein